MAYSETLIFCHILYTVYVYIYTYVCVGLSEIVYSQTTWFFIITCPIEMTIWIHLGADYFQMHPKNHAVAVVVYLTWS